MINTLNKISNWSLFRLIISDQALITLKQIFAYTVHFNWQKFSGVFFRKVVFQSKSIWLKMQKYAF